MSIRAIGVVALLMIGSFGGGFLVGRGMLGELRTRITEAESRAASFREHLDEAKVRVELVDAMAHLREVALDVTDNNFGEAREVMRRVRQVVDSAYEKAANSEALRTALASIRERLNEIDADLRSLKVEARDKIDAVVGDLRRLVGQ